MKILHVITGLSTGGAERALFTLLSGGLANRLDNTVVSLGGRGTMGSRIEELGVPVYALEMRSCIPWPRVLLQLRRIVRAFDPDVIQGWMYHGNLAATAASRMGRVHARVVWNIRHSLYDLKAEKYLTRYVIQANRFFSGQADTLIYNSRLSKKQHETYGFVHTRSRIIPNGFDMKQLRSQPDVGLAVRHEFAIPYNTLVVGHVARFHPVKDHALFLKAAVQTARTAPNTHFLLVGREVWPDNPLLSNIVPANLMDRFHFAGERMDVDRLMQAMDIFCLSSWSEAFPNVLGEAMATQVPCVATDVGDSADIVGDTGIIVPPKNQNALTEGLLRLLTMSVDALSALGELARKRIAHRYALPAIATRYINLYKKVYDDLGDAF